MGRWSVGCEQRGWRVSMMISVSFLRKVSD